MWKKWTAYLTWLLSFLKGKYKRIQNCRSNETIFILQKCLKSGNQNQEVFRQKFPNDALIQSSQDSEPSKKNFRNADVLLVLVDFSLIRILRAKDSTIT